MSQNISSRKQELLSRLKNTLAIVSQATGFDRLDDDPSHTNHREVNKHPLDPRSGARRQANLQPNYSQSTPASLLEHDRWSSHHEVVPKQLVGGQQWNMNVDGDHPQTIVKTASSAQSFSTALNSKQPDSKSMFKKLEEIDDEDEFLYGKEESKTPTTQWSRTVDDSYWSSNTARSQISKSSSTFPAGCLRNSNRSQLPSQASTVDETMRDLNVSGMMQSSAQQSLTNYGNSSSIQRESEPVRSSNASAFPQRSAISSASSNSGGDSVIGIQNVNTDMLQNILKLVSLQKAQQPPQNTIPKEFEWNQDPRLTQQFNISHTSNRDQRSEISCQPHLSSQFTSSAGSSSDLPSKNYSHLPQTPHHMQLDSQDPHEHKVIDKESLSTSLTRSKEQDMTSKAVSSSSMQMPSWVSNAPIETKTNMSSLISAAESETFNEMSALLSDAATRTEITNNTGKAVCEDNSNATGEALNRLFSVLGCNTDIISMMQQFIKKTDVEVSVKGKKQPVPGSVQQEASVQKLGHLPENSQQKEESDNIHAGMLQVDAKSSSSSLIKSPTNLDSHTAIEASTSGNPGGVEERNRRLRSISPVLSSAPMHQTFGNEDDYNPHSPSCGEITHQYPKTFESPNAEDRLMSKVQDSNQSLGKDAEWEKSTEEFLRRLQTKKLVVPSREKSRSPQRSLRIRPRSPKRHSNDRSQSPRRQSNDRSPSPKPPSSRPIVRMQNRDDIDKTAFSQNVRTEKFPNKGATITSGDKASNTSNTDNSASVSDEDRLQLLKAKEELTSTLVLLKSELDKLRVEQNSLLRGSDNRDRSEEVRNNVALQEEMCEHIGALKKAMNDLNSQLGRKGATEINESTKLELTKKKKVPTATLR